eukprot:5132449-Prymnesium_polylepis.1
MHMHACWCGRAYGVGWSERREGVVAVWPRSSRASSLAADTHTLKVSMMLEVMSHSRHPHVKAFVHVHAERCWTCRRRCRSRRRRARERKGRPCARSSVAIAAVLEQDDHDHQGVEPG